MQQSSSQYGVSPEMVSYPGDRSHMLDQLQQQHLLQQQQEPGDVATVLAEAASPISSRPPARVNFEDLALGASGFPDEDGLAGDDVERGATTGNRWPRQETLALLKIRSEMDAAFKEATLKGPLWEDVSRKLADLGYRRSSKKCKEKFENVHKYYKRTKEGRAGRPDGRTYRFFSELEALHNSSNTANTTSIAATTAPPVLVSVTMGSSNAMVGSSAGIIQSPAMASAPAVIISDRPDSTINAPAAGISGSAAAAAISFSSNSSSSSGSEEDEIEESLNMDTRKRKRTQLGGGSNKKMMAFFERLMKEVMEKQEGMMQRFLEAIEKREKDRMIREEAWRLQEMARLTREQEMLAQERAIAASKDAAVIAFLQQITGQTVQIITPVAIPAPAPPMQPNPPPPPPKLNQQQQQQQQQQQYQQQQQKQQQQQEHRQQQSQVIEVMPHQAPSSEVVPVQQEQPEATGMSFDSPPSRWPKAEVLALIKLRTSLESKYLESVPKGPLWEDISAGMQRLGYKRSAKRCKEKWENINKYFKKVKESNKKRPEDAKTCPYFHELDTIYRNKLQKSSAISYGTKQEQEMNPDQSPKLQETSNVLAILPPAQSDTATEILTNNNKNGGNSDVAGGSLVIQTSNGGLPPSFFEVGSGKKPEDIVKELMGGGTQHNHKNDSHHHHSQQQQAVMEEYDKLDDSDDLDQDDEDDSDDDEEDEDEDEAEDQNSEGGKIAYKIEYQRPNQGPSNAQGNAAGSFLAMVQ